MRKLLIKSLVNGQYQLIEKETSNIEAPGTVLAEGVLKDMQQLKETTEKQRRLLG